MNKGILIEQDLINNIIELANKRAVAEDRQFPNGIDFFSDKGPISNALSPTKEDTALKKAIEDLSPDEIRELCAIMYLGRDYSDDVGVEKAIAFNREDAKARELKDVERSLFEKVPLGEYLSDGLKKLKH